VTGPNNRLPSISSLSCPPIQITSPTTSKVCQNHTCRSHRNKQQSFSDSSKDKQNRVYLACGAWCVSLSLRPPSVPISRIGASNPSINPLRPTSRARKIKCDGARPVCATCIRRKSTKCVYDEVPKRRGPDRRPRRRPDLLGGPTSGAPPSAPRLAQRSGDGGGALGHTSCAGAGPSRVSKPQLQGQDSTTSEPGRSADTVGPHVGWAGGADSYSNTSTSNISAVALFPPGISPPIYSSAPNASYSYDQHPAMNNHVDPSSKSLGQSCRLNSRSKTQHINIRLFLQTPGYAPDGSLPSSYARSGPSSGLATPSASTGSNTTPAPTHAPLHDLHRLSFILNPAGGHGAPPRPSAPGPFSLGSTAAMENNSGSASAGERGHQDQVVSGCFAPRLVVEPQNKRLTCAIHAQLFVCTHSPPAFLLQNASHQSHLPQRQRHNLGGSYQFDRSKDYLGGSRPGAGFPRDDRAHGISVSRDSYLCAMRFLFLRSSIFILG
jgi:hypothetical protein